MFSRVCATRGATNIVNTNVFGGSEAKTTVFTMFFVLRVRGRRGGGGTKMTSNLLRKVKLKVAPLELPFVKY